MGFAYILLFEDKLIVALPVNDPSALLENEQWSSCGFFWNLCFLKWFGAEVDSWCEARRLSSLMTVASITIVTNDSWRFALWVYLFCASWLQYPWCQIHSPHQENGAQWRGNSSMGADNIVVKVCGIYFPLKHGHGLCGRVWRCASNGIN